MEHNASDMCGAVRYPLVSVY